jgi:putative oxidoreductase
LNQEFTVALSITAKNRAIWGVRILLALAFGAAGAAKLAGVEQMVATFEVIGWGQWFRYVTGGIEVAGALLMLIPATGVYAGLLLGGTMVGGTVSHLLVVPGSPVPALVLGLLCALVVWHNRPAQFRND